MLLSRVCQTGIKKRCVKHGSTAEFKTRFPPCFVANPATGWSSHFSLSSASLRAFIILHNTKQLWEVEGRSLKAGAWDGEGRLQGQRQWEWDPVRQATVVLTDTSKGNFFF